MEAAQIIPWVAVVALAAIIGWLVIGRARQGAQPQDIERLVQAVNEQAEKAREQSDAQAREAREELRDNLNARVRELAEAQARASEAAGTRLDSMRKSSDEQIGKIREMVEEKLQDSLEKRIASSFEQVSSDLKKVHEGVGEMQKLAQDVGGLKRLLDGVRTRGIFAEFQLRMLLEDSLAPGQFIENARLGGGGQVVEFAICLPNSDGSGEPLLLPLDSKFPLTPYENLQDALDSGADSDTVEAMRKKFAGALKIQAKEITKYISPPHTTTFALMFLPVEGMYAEALRMSETWNDIRDQFNVVIVGPTTLHALLQSLQMGFRTLAISERSHEAWLLLQKVGKEFDKIVEQLAKSEKSLGTATGATAEARRLVQAQQSQLAALTESEALSAPPSPGTARPEPDGGGNVT